MSGFALPASLKYVIDDVIPARNIDLLYRILAIVGVAVTMQAVTSFILTRMLSVQAQGLIAELRKKVQRHVLHLPLGYFDNVKSGEVVSRVMTDVEGVRNLVGTGLVHLVGGVLTSVVALVLLVNIDPKLTGIALVPMILFAVISMKAFKKIRPIFRERGKIQARVTGRLVESLGGIRVVKGFGAEETEKRAFGKGVDELFDNVKTTLTTSSFVTSLATLLIGIASVAIIGVGSTFIHQGSLSTGDLFTFFALLAYLVMPIVQMSNIGTQITEAFAGLDRTEEILGMEREGEEKERTHVFGPIRGEIRFEGVSFGYTDDREVLHDIDMVAPPGTVTAFVGSSGSEKTTRPARPPPSSHRSGGWSASTGRTSRSRSSPATGSSWGWCCRTTSSSRGRYGRTSSSPDRTPPKRISSTRWTRRTSGSSRRSTRMGWTR
jgi:subfamily B ATP-binding cassette protein MsbA